MKMKNTCELLNKYSKCPTCGNEYVGNGQGTLNVEDTEFERTCKCGWKINIKELPDGSLVETYNSITN